MNKVEVISLKEYFLWLQEMAEVENEKSGRPEPGIVGLWNYAYRGEQTEYEKPCISAFGRYLFRRVENYSLRETQSVEEPVIEMNLLSSWVGRSELLLNKTFSDNPWEQLMTARHYGLSTRLVDWTSNPLVALYFACRVDSFRIGEKVEGDGVVYATPTHRKLVSHTSINSEPIMWCGNSYVIKPRVRKNLNMDSENSYLFIKPPVGLGDRPVKQSSIFYCSNDPKKSAFEHSHAGYSVLIPRAFKGYLLEELERCGVNETSLGLETLDSIALNINEMHTSMFPVDKLTSQQDELNL